MTVVITSNPGWFIGFILLPSSISLVSNCGFCLVSLSRIFLLNFDTNWFLLNFSLCEVIRNAAVISAGYLEDTHIDHTIVVNASAFDNGLDDAIIHMSQMKAAMNHQFTHVVQDLVTISNSIEHQGQQNSDNFPPIMPISSRFLFNNMIVYKLGRQFFNVPCVDLAKNLLGKVLVRRLPMGDSDVLILAARIVETESYLGYEDKASHSYNGRKTARNDAMYLPPGHAYVYQLHTHHCMNITSGPPLESDSSKIDQSPVGSAVLIRAAQPLVNCDWMLKNRYTNQRQSTTKIKKSKSSNSSSKGQPKLKNKDICNGPGKLCSALNINKVDFNEFDLTLDEANFGATVSKNSLHLVDETFLGILPISPDMVQSGPRIGLGKSAEEWANAPLRFYLKDNEFVSKKTK